MAALPWPNCHRSIRIWSRSISRCPNWMVFRHCHFSCGKDYPKLPVIMFSTLTEARSCRYVRWAGSRSNRLCCQACQRRQRGRWHGIGPCQLIPKIKSLCPFNASAASIAGPVATVPKILPKRPISKNQRCDAVVIGLSTGGPHAHGSSQQTASELSGPHYRCPAYASGVHAPSRKSPQSGMPIDHSRSSRWRSAAVRESPHCSW